VGLLERFPDAVQHEVMHRDPGSSPWTASLRFVVHCAREMLDGNER
jgi:hypothetical protein